MKLKITFIVLISFCTSFAQEEKDVYSPKADSKIENILTRYDISSNTCGDTKFSVGKSAEMVVFQVNDNNVIVVLSKNSRGADMAEIKKYYCINKNTLTTFFRKRDKPEFGLITVPFKMRLAPIKIMAGNTIGPYIGKSFEHANRTSSTILGFASLTNVPLNDLNDEVPETKWGVGIGGGYVWKITGNFQSGIISGIDFFEGVEKWPYKFQPWLSLSIGFNFTSKSEKALDQAH